MKLTKLTKQILNNQIDCCKLTQFRIEYIEITKSNYCSKVITLKICGKNEDIANRYLKITYCDEVQSDYIEKEYLSQNKTCSFTLNDIEPVLLDDIILTEEENQIIKKLIKKYNFDSLVKYIYAEDHQSTVLSLHIYDNNITVNSLDIPNDVALKFEPESFKGLLCNKKYKRTDFEVLEEKENENN